MTKEHYNDLIQEIKNDKDFYVGQVDDLLIVKNSKGEKRVLSKGEDNWFGYWLEVNTPAYDLSGKINGALRAGQKGYAKCEKLEDIKRVVDGLSIS